MVWQRAHISTVNRPSTSRNGPVEVPQNEQRGPTPHLIRLELTFDEVSSRRKSQRSLRAGLRPLLTRLAVRQSGATGRPGSGGETAPPADRDNQEVRP